MRNGLLQPAVATGIMNNISALQDTMNNLDRIANTPLPFAYQAHLRMSLWIYLFLLPVSILLINPTVIDADINYTYSSKYSSPSNT